MITKMRRCQAINYFIWKQHYLIAVALFRRKPVQVNKDRKKKKEIKEKE